MCLNAKYREIITGGMENTQKWLIGKHLKLKVIENDIYFTYILFLLYYNKTY